MRRKWLAVLGFVPAVALGQLSFGPTLTGTTSVVNDGPGDQTDPHVSCDSVAYTSDMSGASEIRYHDLRSGADSAIPNNGAFDSLSDVSGNRIVFTRSIPGQSAIYLFDTSAPATAPVPLDPVSGSERRAAAIGGGTVAWQDFTYSASLLDSEVVVYDVASRAVTRLTDDLLLDRSPAVSPDGKVVVFSKCEITGTQCDIYKAVKSGGSFGPAEAITGPTGDESLPDTNGEVIVYGSSRGAEQDIYFQPVAGGPERQLVLPGDDVNPNVSGTLIAFEHLDPGAFNRDILLYDMATQTAYRLTDTVGLDETLNDISVCADGLVRVVYTVHEGTGTAPNFNVYAFSFRLAAPAPACSNGTCANPGTRPLLTTFEVARTTGAPNFATRSFQAQPGPGLLCVENAKATSGWVKLNGDVEICPSAFHSWTQSIERKVTLRASNSAKAIIAGAPGTSYTVRVYGTDPACTASTSQPLVSRSELRVRAVGGGEIHSVSGTAASVSDDGVVDLSGLMPQQAPDVGDAQGCASAGGDPLAAGLMALLGMWAAQSRRRTAERSARRASGRAAARE